jgi:hypothetical protein
MTTEEQERRAYADGRLNDAILLGRIIDAQAEIDALRGYLRDAVDRMTQDQERGFHECNPGAQEAIE